MRALLALLVVLALAPGAAAAQEVALRLDWSDLQPEGEEAVLEQMYRDFYEDLERRRAAAVSPLSGIDEMDGMGGDPAGLGMGGIQEGGAFDTMPQIGTFNTVEALDGETVEIPGFIVPLDGTGANLRSFLLVPYFGACIHTPPPPPNQIVYVTVDTELAEIDLWEPQWARGTLSAKRADTDLGDAAYTLSLSAMRPYDY